MITNLSFIVIHKMGDIMTDLTKLYVEILNEDDYITHDNGGRPFSVHIEDNELSVYKLVSGIYRTEVKKVFTGDTQDDNSSVLVEIKPENLKYKYIFIGQKIYSFETTEPIKDYHTMIGNSNVPYPVAVSDKYAYFMLDDVYIDKKEFPHNIDWRNAYGYFYGDIDDKDKKVKMKHYKVINKRLIDEAIKKGKHVRNLINLYEKILNEANGCTSCGDTATAKCNDCKKPLCSLCVKNWAGRALCDECESKRNEGRVRNGEFGADVMPMNKGFMNTRRSR